MAVAVTLHSCYRSLKTDWDGKGRSDPVVMQHIAFLLQKLENRLKGIVILQRCRSPGGGLRGSLVHLPSNVLQIRSKENILPTRNLFITLHVLVQARSEPCAELVMVWPLVCTVCISSLSSVSTPHNIHTIWKRYTKTHRGHHYLGQSKPAAFTFLARDRTWRQKTIRLMLLFCLTEQQHR